MLRIESYVTPIILSYVDKYIKNLKPEDSKVSLWGGDAVFSNLDLKLDVLEEELKLPFSFLNGHIHELRIHVPWTKLTSEPIIITINTIECILKLKGYEECEVESSTHSSKDADVSSPEGRKRQRRQEIETPTSYIQGLINKVINNVIIVFNNVILKYVEDDIVLSINAKTIEFRSVDQKWTPSFVDLTNEDPVLRNVASVTDLTVCLDKRNASGKIDIYQEPLLYRCSLSCRIMRQFQSLYSFQPKITRYDVFCPQLHFSLSDTQLPMFIRLLELLIALYYKQLQYQPPSSDLNKNTSFEMDEEMTLIEGSEESWSSWAWSIGSSLNPFQWAEYEDSSRSRLSNYSSTLHVGVYIDTATWVFKLTELLHENTYFGPTKVQFTPFLKMVQRCLFMTAVVKGLEAVNVQMGISSLSVFPIGDCVCGVEDSREHCFEKCENENVPNGFQYVKCGDVGEAFISMSLFDETSSEDDGWTYEFLWDDHVNSVTVEAMLRRTGFFGLDYLYTMDIPSDATSDQLSEINSFPESSNLNARSLCRTAFGSLSASFDSGFIHRLQAIVFACQQSEYAPYTSSHIDDNEAVPSEDEILFLLSNFPSRKYVFTFIEPCVSIGLAQHQFLDVKSIFSARRKKKLNKSTQDNCIVTVPSIAAKFSKIDVEIVKPMYPKRLITVASLMKPLTEQAKENCYLRSLVKFHNCSASLHADNMEYIQLFEKFSLNLHFKSLLHPEFWISSCHSLTEIVSKADAFALFLSMPQISLIYSIMKSWLAETGPQENLEANTLVDDAIRGFRKFEVLKIELQKFDCKYCETSALYAMHSTIERISLALCKSNREMHSYIVNGPDNSSVEDFDNACHADKLVTVSLQLPTKHNADGVLSVLYVHTQKVAIICGPQIISWLKYAPRLLSRKKELDSSIGKAAKKAGRKASDNSKIGSSSATFSEVKTSSKTQFDPHISSVQSSYRNWKERFGQVYPLINSLNIHIEVSSWTIFFPIKPLHIPSKSGLVNAVHRFYLTRGEKSCLEDTTVVCLPAMLLQNANHKHEAATKLRDVPITFASLPFSEGKDKLPWSLKFSNFQVYSLQGLGESIKLPILKTVNTAATIAVTSKMKGSEVCQLGIVIHLDMSPVDFCGSRRQVETHVTIADMLLGLLSFYNVFEKKLMAAPFISEPHPLDEILKEHTDLEDTLASQGMEAKLEHNKTVALLGINQEGSKVQDQTSTNSAKEGVAFLSPVDCGDHSQSLPLKETDEQIDKTKESDMDPSSLCVTTWVQWTVARTSASLFVHHGPHTKKLKAEVEDFTLWVDLHQVYSKFRCKIATVNVFHYIKMNSEWLIGEKEGIILTVGDQLVKDLVILDSSSHTLSDRPTKATNLPAAEMDHSKSRGFLSLTVTVAQCKNIHSKWNQAIKKHLREERYLRESSAPQYLGEVDLRMQSFDCVFYPPTLESFASIYEPWFQLKSSWLQFKTAPQPEKYILGLNINSKALPLMYVHTEPIRVFLPADQHSTEKNVHNVIMIQLESLLISPQVDNPLSRIVLRQDLFTAAEQSRILGVPGAEVEDRQYQMDFLGFSISTGYWEDIVNEKCLRRRSGPSEHLGITGENPAYEWNNYDLTTTSSDILIYPLIARLNTRVIAAPAIVYSAGNDADNTASEPLLVAGHSLEVNALTDCDIFASIQQLILLNKIIDDGASLISRVKMCKQDSRCTLSSDIMDSGVDCDASSIDHSKRASRGIREEEQSMKRLDFVPLEVLITGNRITLNIFDRCVADGNIIHIKGYQKSRSERKAKTKHRQYLVDMESTESEASPKRIKTNFISPLKVDFHNDLSTEPSLEEGYEGSEEESVYEMQLAASEPHIRIVPLMFISVSQPHTFFTLQPNQQKIDVSIFDLSIKSVPKGSSVRATEMKKLPAPEDFTTSWVETRPGDLHPKTGIPPAFFTFSAFNFLHTKARFSVDVGRPFRLIIGQDKWDQIAHVMSTLKKVLPEKPLKVDSSSSASFTSPEYNPAFLASLKKKLHPVECVSLTTSQVVVNVEIPSSFKSKFEIHLSFSKFFSNLSTAHKKQKQGTEIIAEISIESNIQGLQLKTGFSDLAIHTVVKPWTVNGELKLLWNRWKSEPDIKVKVESEVLQLELGPESLFCLSEIHDVLLGIVRRLDDTERYDKSERSQLCNEFYSDLFFQDDLRAGVFEYVSASSSSVQNSIPKPYQVLFNKSDGTMVWCYPEPRALLKVEIYPVPFISANRTTTNDENEDSRRQCSLQYFSHMRNSFVTYKHFFLSECNTISLNLPQVHEISALAVSTIWRVCINRNENEVQNDVLLLSPEALAACIRVDSLFSVGILPKIQVALMISKCDFTLFNHLDVTGSQIPEPFHGCEVDDAVPSKHAFVTITFDGIVSKCSSWMSGTYAEIDGILSIEVLNYKYLTNNLFLEPAVVSSRVAFQNSEEKDDPKCIDCNVRAKAFCIHASQSIIHTFFVAEECWRQASLIFTTLRSPTVKRSLPIVLMTNYYIVNKSVEVIRFGQANTDENLLLEPGAVHFYAWRSQRFPAKLQICNESNKWKWCEAFSVNIEGNQLCTVVDPYGKESKYLISCEKLSWSQMMVTVNGLLSIGNSLFEDVEVRVIDRTSREEASSGARCSNAIALKAQSISPSFFGDPHSLRLKFSFSSIWSGEISLHQDSVTVRIPMKKKEYMSVICKVYRETIASAVRVFVVFCPHFIVRSHLPRPHSLFVNTPSNNTTQKETIKGRGHAQPLSCDSSQIHHLTLQLSPELEVSKPPIQISRGLIDQVKNSTDKCANVSTVMKSITSCSHRNWPYIDSSLVNADLLFTDQPEINLQIQFTSLLPNCRSLVIDIRPWILIVNHTGTEILLNECSSPEKIWYIPPGVVFSPPKLESTFTFGVVTAQQRYFSIPLQLSAEEHWYALKIDGKIPRRGSASISIAFERKIFLFTVLSRFEENIQILHLIPTCTISNNTNQILTVRSFVIQAQVETVQLSSLPCVVVAPKSVSTSNLREVPLIVWDTLDNESLEKSKESLYLQMGKDDQYSSPVHVAACNRDLRLAFTIPLSNGSNEPFLLTMHPSDSQLKYVIQEDPSPQMRVYNNTSESLVMGQESLSRPGCVEEELDPICDFPSVSSHKSSFYNFRFVAETYPEILPPTKKTPKLHLALPAKHASSEFSKVCWSYGLNIREENVQFVNIPGYSDVKVRIEKVGHTSHVFIDPANRVEISAKDVRSRIALLSLPEAALAVREPEVNYGLHVIESDPDTDIGQDGQLYAEPPTKADVEERSIVYFSCFCPDLQFVLTEDMNTEDSRVEFLRFSLDNFRCNVRPLITNTVDKTKSNCLRCGTRMEVVLSADDAQIDNQLFSEGNFDFPVILVRQKSKRSLSSSSDVEETLLHIASVIDFQSSSFSFRSLDIQVRPLMLYMEDAFISYISVFLGSLISVVSKEVIEGRVDDDDKTLRMKLPKDILIKSNAMTRPLQISHINIGAISMLLSIHASVKLYIALDQSPLHFAEYVRHDVITTGYSLGYNLAMHYLSSALFRAGWVVSSLDLLGNPGGFARTVGSGLKDFVQLPFEGILQGPWAFMAGITHGSMSLMKHISTGTLVSITNLASSVARNMELLSLDEDHLIRNEANRRSKPRGISSSILQGFSSFGISLLGAIGGLAHQPIQAMLCEEVSASSLIGSFGKGMVGVVAKPIGGVADLVVHAGQGLLHGTGWKEDLQPRAKAARESKASSPNSSLKFVWKFLVSLPKECRNIICAADATLVTQASSYSPVTVLLSPQVLFIVDVKEDSQQHVFTLNDLKWRSHSHDPTLLYLEKSTSPILFMSDDAEPISGCPERVADYVRSTYSEGLDASQIESDSNEEESERDAKSPRVKLYLSPQLRSYLITCIEIVVRSNKGQGFIS